MAGWEPLQGLVKMEMLQRREEGCEVQGFDEKLAEAGNDPVRLMAVYEELSRLSVRDDFPFTEPNGLDAIRALRPDGPRDMTGRLSPDRLQDQLYGAWLGRSAGCALGKPLETDSFMGFDGSPGWKNVRLWFEGADAWPIADYTPGSSRAAAEHGLEIAGVCSASFRENIRFMETDDDIRYTVLGLLLLEQKGLDWDSWDVGKLWHKYLTYGQVCTAETQAYLNFAQITSHIRGPKPSDWPKQEEWVRTYLNPYREWIGAQIRVDGLAYGVAGNPAIAAELAWRDASFSHVKNGIYGAMFVSAMIAAAFAESDPERIVEIGLSEIPFNCRLSRAIRKAVDIAKSSSSQMELVERIWTEFKSYNAVHTINNAALVAASLVYAKGDFETAITTAVLGGWDTDCNGATVGSIMGAVLGAKRLPEKWTTKLNDMLYAEVNGFHPAAISACANRSYEVFRKLSPL